MDSRHLFILLVIVKVTISVKTSPFVQTSSGAVLGNRIEILNKEIHEYLGIPYAQPPTGDLRFSISQAVDPWEGIYEATEKPLSCFQYNSWDTPLIPSLHEVSEDCLYLNIWVPFQGTLETTKYKGTLKPIMVWIYGGAFRVGSSTTNIYDGGVLASYGEVIVASMNYRVGVFGFLNAGVDEAPGNMGLLDQRLAIEWIKNNAKSFGGDPDRITIFGESAGSISAGLHILSPLSQGLFSRAIMQSGSPYHPELGGESSCVTQEKADKLARAVGCSNEEQSIKTHPREVVACLKGKEPTILAKAENAMFTGIVSYLPSFGDDFLPAHGITTLRDGKFSPVEVMTGVTSNEGAVFVIDMLSDSGAVTLEEAKAGVKNLFTERSNSFVEDVYERYFSEVDGSDHAAIFQAICDVYGDYLITCPEVLFSQAYPKQKNNLFYYLFDHHSSTAFGDDYTGMSHFEDVQFVFGVPLKDPANYTKKEVELSRFIMDTWVKFAKEGNPRLPTTESWKPYASEDPSLLRIYLESKNISKETKQDICQFWDKLFG